MTKKEIAALLDQAARTAQAVPQMAAANLISLSEAYEIQWECIDLRLKRGEKITGHKLGFTSRAKMIQMGVSDLIWGILTDQMELTPGAQVDLTQWIHPRVEPEIAFRVSENIDREISREELPQFIDSMAAALEIIDSRYEDFKFSLEDVVADNCSSTGYVVGDWHPLSMDISDLKIDFLENDQLVDTATSAAILDDPLLSILALSRLAEQSRVTIEKGQVIFAGAATAAHYMQPGNRYSTTIERLGTVGFSVQ